ncbi:MAG: putative Ig domain-containing protein [Desulfobacterales bacterium]
MQHKIVCRNMPVFVILFLSIITFLAYPAASHALDIAGAEYFFDNDPGEGNGISLPAADGGFDSPEESVDLSEIDTSTLTVGNHTLYVRFISADGVWGMARPVSFDPLFRSPYNFRITGEKWIAGAEYFIDDDPGTGSGIPVSATDGEFNDSKEELELAGIDISSLSTGIHTLYLRLQDNEGTWGVIRKVAFEIYEPETIAGAEYFIDNDPGPGNGTPLSAKDGVFDSAEEDLDISSIATTGLSEGVHTLYVRFKDSLDRWGASLGQEFAVSRPIAYTPLTPVQPATGDGLIPLSVVVADQSGSNTCMLKIEYAHDGSGNWRGITIEQGSLSASYGNPALDNGADYQIGGASGWIESGSGPNTVSFVWLSVQDMGKIAAADIRLRFTVYNGAAEHVTFTESAVFSLDSQAPDIPVIVPYALDPTGDTTPALTWLNVHGAASYHLQVATDAGFNNIVLDQSDIAATYYAPASPLPYGEIYWHISAVDSLGNESPFSITDQFNIIADTASPSVILSYSAVSPVAAGPLTITAVFSEPLVTVPEIAIDQPGSADIAPTPMNGSGNTWSYFYAVSCADGSAYLDGTAAVTVNNGLDYAGNENTPAQNNIFEIDTSVCGSGNIIAAEYFFDVDPGKGNGIAVSAADDAFDSSEESVDLSGIDISSLKIGSHTLYVRFKSADGIWGIARPVVHDPHFTSPYNFQITGDRWIAAAEYFIDVDSGEGNGTPVSAADGVFDAPEEELVISGIDISYLGTGSHVLYLRVQDNEGTWGVVRQVSFEIYEPFIIAGAEYFIDNDPGPGNGTPVSAKDGSFDSAEEDLDTDIATTGLPEGVHTFYVRFKDQLGRWGAFSSHAFAIGRPVAFTGSTPVQPATGDGRIPFSVTVADQSGSNTCSLKIECAMNGSDNWQLITIEEGSVSAAYGIPLLDNNAEYQIGGTGGWIETGSGANTVSFVWLSTDDLGKTDAAGVNLRFTIHNGTAEHVTSTESMIFSVDTQAPNVPILLPYAPDPTGDTTPVLAWNRVLGAGYYHLQIAADSAFSNILLNQSDIAGTSYVMPGTLPYGDIYWRVSAVDDQGNESFFSITDHFVIVQNTDPPSVTLSYSALSPVAAGPVSITALFSEPLATVPEIAIDQPGNADLSSTAMTGSGTTWAYTYTVQCADGSAHVDGTATVTISNGFDYAGNENTPAQNNSFDIDTSACGSGNITGAEYFFDIDPGKGNGVSLQAADGAFDSPEESVDLSGVDTSSLSIGNHTLYVRFKKADGVWGLSRPVGNDPLFDSPYNFRITGEKWVAGAEYFIDVDPDAGNGKPVPATDGEFNDSEEKFELADIDISYLSAGPHTLYLRVQDSEGAWGIIREISFEIYEPTSIAGAEYFIDDDPGPGNGTPVLAKDESFDSAEEQVDISGIDVSSLSEGDHTFYVRFKDQLGRWGAPLGKTFEYNPFLLTIVSTNLPDGKVGKYYSSRVVVSGGICPYSFSVQNGILPPGLILNETTGDIGGTPTAAGSYTFTMQVTDAESSYVEREFTMEIISLSNITNLITTPGDGQTTLHWIDPDDPDLIGLRIYKSVDGINYSLVEELTPDTTSYTISDLINNGIYYFKITALYADGIESQGEMIISIPRKGATITQTIIPTPPDEWWVDVEGQKITLQNGEFSFRPDNKKYGCVLKTPSGYPVINWTCFAPQEYINEGMTIKQEVYSLTVKYRDTDYNACFAIRYPKNGLDSDGKPVIFLHGLNGEANYWYGAEHRTHWTDSLPDLIEDMGYNVWRVFYPKDEAIKKNAYIVGLAIKEILKKYPASDTRAHIVTHSMGGLVFRALLQDMAVKKDGSSQNISLAELELSADDFEKVIFIAPPFHGSIGANNLSGELGEYTKIITRAYVKFLAKGDSASPAYRDLKVGSDFTWELTRNPFPLASQDVLVIAGTNDFELSFDDTENNCDDGMVAVCSANMNDNINSGFGNPMTVDRDHGEIIGNLSMVDLYISRSAANLTFMRDLICNFLNQGTTDCVETGTCKCSECESNEGGLVWKAPEGYQADWCLEIPEWGRCSKIHRNETSDSNYYFYGKDVLNMLFDERMDIEASTYILYGYKGTFPKYQTLVTISAKQVQELKTTVISVLQTDKFSLAESGEEEIVLTFVCSSYFRDLVGKITVTDPGGKVIGYGINEIGENALYGEMEMNGDAYLDSGVSIKSPVAGTYAIDIEIQPDAEDTDMISLEVKINDSYQILSETEVKDLSSTSFTCQPDLSPPQGITDLEAYTDEDDGAVVLRWTAPADDTIDEQCQKYQIRYSSLSITEDNWLNVPILTLSVKPALPSMKQTYQAVMPENGQQYYFAVKDMDEMGLLSPISNVVSCTSGPGGSGLPDDATRPSTPEVYDEGEYTFKTSGLIFDWTATDPESGIVNYRYAVGTCPYAQDLRSYIDVGLATSVTIDDIVFEPYTTCYLSIQAINAAGLVSCTGCSNGITVLPDEADPYDPVNLAVTASGQRIYMSWDNPPSGNTKGFKIYLSQDGGDTYEPPFDVLSVNSFAIDVIESGTYTIKVTGYDEQGNESAGVETSVELCLGDFDTDGDVDGSDLAVFAADFGRTDCSGDCKGDFDADGDVDGSDLAVFAADFGRTDCP